MPSRFPFFKNSLMKRRKNENQLTGVYMVRVFTGRGFRTDYCVTSKSFKMVRVLAYWSFKTDLGANFNGVNLTFNPFTTNVAPSCTYREIRLFVCTSKMC